MSTATAEPPATKTIKVPQQLFREATIRAEGEGDAQRFRMSISSDEPYLRYDFWNNEEYWEVLSHAPGDIDEARLKAGLPILFNHTRDQHLARATKYSNNGHRIEVSDFIWSESDFAKSKRADAVNGSLPDTSVGYTIDDEGECIGAKDGKPIYKFKWTPFEGSIVTVPADIKVGVGRNRDHKPAGEPKIIEIADKKDVDATRKSENTRTTEKTMETKIEVPDQPKPQQIDVKEVESKAVTQERKRVSDIQDLVVHFRDKGLAGRKVDAHDTALQFIKDGKSAREFQDAVVMGGFKEVVAVDPPEVGLNQKEKRRFSLMTAIRTLANKRPLEGFEKEVSDAAAKKSGISQRPDAIYLPEDITAYDLRENPEFDIRAFAQYFRTNQNVTTATAGGFTVPTILGSLIELLRNKTVLGQAGITTISGLQGDLEFPVQTAGASATWVSESGSLSDSAATFAQKKMTPHRLGGTIPFTTQFLAQSNLSAEQFVRNELMTVSAIALDLAGLEGTGVNGQPLGVKGTPNVGADVTFSGAAAWGKIVDFETYINVANADIGSMAFILSSATVGKWKQILKVTAGAAGQFLIQDGQANGYPVLRTNQITGNIAFFGVWSQLLHAMWATQEVIVDPYALKKSGGIEVTMNSFHDFLVRQPAAFEVSTDTAAT